MRFAALTAIVATLSVDSSSSSFAPSTAAAAAARSVRPRGRRAFAAGGAAAAEDDANRRRRSAVSDAVRSFAGRPPLSSSSFSSRRLAARRYGPEEEPPPPSPSTSSFDDSSDDAREDDADDDRRRREAKEKLETEFDDLLERIVRAADPNHLPSIASKNVDLILSLRGREGIDLLEGALERAKSSAGESHYEAVAAAIDYLMTFAEEFVNRAKSIDDGNKALLGKIVRTMTSNEGVGVGRRGNEGDLDELLEREKENFTPGFLRHVEGECARIESAPRMTPESGKLLQTLRIIQARVVEELGKDLGEAALVLGQLLGYDDDTERYAVLDAGLTVRGVEFAKEMAALTEEASEGFQKVPGGADPGLVSRVKAIDRRIKEFIEKRK